MKESPFLPLPEGMYITQIQEEATELMIVVVSVRPSSSCPLCAQASSSVHSCYTRTVHDVPCGGRNVLLRLCVRKFFCRNPQCPRKVFTERIPSFVEPWAQMTLRLRQAIEAIGLSTCGSLGARLADRLGISTSWMTVLRRIMALPTPAESSVTVLGIDDFAFRRRRKFGTVLVDLEQHQIIDLLPERSVQSSAGWMRHHPEIKYVSRDRGTDYAQGAREGAPQAVQCADRFHLMKNLVEAIEPVVACSYKELRKGQAARPSLVPPRELEWRQALSPGREHQRLTRLAHNQERLRQMRELHQSGVRQEEIARRLGVTSRTVRRWMKRSACPGSERRSKRQSIFDPYAPHVWQRWQEGCRDLTLIFQEIQAQGYPGKIRTLYRFIQTLRQEPGELAPLSVVDRVSVQEAVWLLVRPLNDLNADEHAALQELCQASSQLVTLHTLVQSFGQIVRRREGHRLEDWIRQVAESGISEVQRFANGLERDKEAVLAGLTLVYSNDHVA